jgi:predicted nucleic-acid-binding Zn-ribbon protein
MEGDLGGGGYVVVLAQKIFSNSSSLSQSELVEPGKYYVSTCDDCYYSHVSRLKTSSGELEYCYVDTTT